MDDARMDRVVGAICNAVMERFVQMASEATRDAPIRKARAILGEDRFTDAAVRALRTRLKDLIAGDRRAELMEWLTVPGAGEALFMADILAGAYQDVTREAGSEPASGATP